MSGDAPGTPPRWTHYARRPEARPQVLTFMRSFAESFPEGIYAPYMANAYDVQARELFETLMLSLDAEVYARLVALMQAREGARGHAA